MGGFEAAFFGMTIGEISAGRVLRPAEADSQPGWVFRSREFSQEKQGDQPAVVQIIESPPVSLRAEVESVQIPP